MRKIMKKTAIILTTAALIAGAGLNVYASEEDIQELYIDAYRVDDEDIKVYVNQNKDDPSWIVNGDPQLKFGSKELTYDSVKEFPETGENITYKCVIDVSGSMDQKRIDEAKEIIKRIGAVKRDEDNVTITTMANDLNKSDYLKDRTELIDEVSDKSVTREDTNLYYGIVEELKELQTHDKVKTKKCLIIFSDGADDQATGITREEATKKVEESHIPVFTVALPKNSSSKKDQEMAKILGSFARLSSGGVHYYSPDYKSDELPSVGDRIVDRLNKSLVFDVDIREFDTDENAHELRITAKTDEGIAEDVINIAESDLKKIRENIAKLPAEPVVEQKPVKVAEPVKKEEKLIFGLKPLYFYLIVASAALLIILIAILIILKTGSSAKADQNSGTDDLGNTVGADDIGVTGGVSDLNGVTLPVDNMGSPTVGFDTPSSGKAYHMTLTRMGMAEDEKSVFKFDLTDKYSVGRSASKSRLSFPKDTAMSGLHCTFYVQDKKIYLRDEGSTNGTFVNGVPITGPYAIEKDDTLIIGSNEYRVTWN
ncbi:MAG: FHA domain-containing protein [Lachnospiraceae bacterium]|nr:FHA domain-containing protein [Lachnospiraceae bacterium]